MRNIPFLQTSRTMFAIAAACAISACSGGGGQQHLTPGTSGLTPSSASNSASAPARAAQSERSATSSNRNEDVDGNDDDGGAVAYSSVPKVIHAVASLGFEAYQGLEFGDGVNLTRTGKLQRVRYVLSSWGCQSGSWYAHNCVTAPGSTFSLPIRINVYAVDNTQPSKVGALLATRTKTFNIPYRPSADNVRCTGAGAGKFYSAVDGRCVNGLANAIVFDFPAPRATLPLKSIFTLVYNTSHYGPNPIGQSTPCYTTSAGCGYDSLNISADGPGGPIGSPIDPDGIFDSFANAGEYCVPALGLGFRQDTAPGCWTTNHPQFEVRVSSGHGEGHEGHDD